MTKITNRIGGNGEEDRCREVVRTNFLFGGMCVFFVYVAKRKGNLSYQRKMLHAKPPLTNTI